MGLRGPKPGSRVGKKKGGRQKGTPNKITAEVKSLAQNYGSEAIDVLVELMRSDEASETRRGAANDLLNRGYGRPAQQTNLAGHDGGPLDLSSMGVTELEAMAARIVATLSQGDKK